MDDKYYFAILEGDDSDQWPDPDLTKEPSNGTIFSNEDLEKFGEYRSVDGDGYVDALEKITNIIANDNPDATKTIKFVVSIMGYDFKQIMKIKNGTIDSVKEI